MEKVEGFEFDVVILERIAMNKRVLLLIVLGSLVIAGSRLSAMEEPALVEVRTLETVEAEMETTQARRQKFAQALSFLNQTKAKYDEKSTEYYNIMVKLAVVINMLKKENEKYQGLQEEYGALKPQETVV